MIEKAFSKPVFGKPVKILLPDGNAKVFLLRKDANTQTKYGMINHNDIVSCDWGDKIKTSIGREVYIFRPNIEEIQLYLAKRKTQVIYPIDSLRMISLSGVIPGSRIGEAGTGSGFLTMYLSCYVGKEGRVFSFDINREAIEIAKENLDLLYCEKNVDFFIFDIRQEAPAEDLDAFFLDMPDPWNAISSVYNSLAPHGRLIVFLPTTNQVIKLLKALENKELFKPIVILENQSREYQLQPDALRPFSVQVVHTGYILSLAKVKQR